MPRLMRLSFLGGGIALFLGVLGTTPAYAHGFGDRYDLPVPLWLYIIGAGAAVAFSFVVVGIFLRGSPGSKPYPRLNLLRWVPARVLVHPAALLPWRVASVVLFLLVITAGLIGKQEPTDNLAPTLVWIVWWVGMAYISALTWNVWSLINPWKIIFGWAESIWGVLGLGADLSLRKQYPKEFGVWPGFLLFLAFAWAELVFVDSAIPGHIARMAIIYSAITWTGMVIYGREQWLRHGEAFTLIFGFLARFAPLEIRTLDSDVCRECPVDCQDMDVECIDCDYCFGNATNGNRELNLRPFAAGLLRNEGVSVAAAATVVLLLSTVTYDGLTATPLWANIYDSVLQGDSSPSFAGTLGLIVFPLLFGGAYLGFASLMAFAVGSRLGVGAAAKGFVYSLIPIALAYHLAHFLSFLLIQGQLIIPLASDPFGFGWDLLGTVDYRVNIAIINARTTWFLAVGAIVVGHVISVYLAHTIGLRILKDRGLALRSQYPLLGLMVGYTMISLWILAQPITEST